jgi:hypothetical protein
MQVAEDSPLPARSMNRGRCRAIAKPKEEQNAAH